MPNRWFSNYAQIVQMACALGAVSLALYRAYPDLQHERFLTIGTAFAFLMVAVVVSSVVVYVKAAHRKQAQDNLLLKALWEAVRAHIRIYREIASEYPNDSRSPLHSASWPEWGTPWQHVHGALFAEAVCFHRTLTLIDQTWATLGWKKEQPIFKVTDSETIVGLLSALDDFDYFVKSKVDVLSAD